MDTLIISNEYVIGDNYEKCLRDFIKYLQLKNYQICLLEKHAWKTNPDNPLISDVLYNGEPAFESIVKHMRTTNYNIYNLNITDRITQNMLDRWITSNDENRWLIRSIYAISSDGTLCKYNVAQINELALNQINGDIISNNLTVIHINAKQINIF